ncbi:hypothetical protein Tco_0174404 [Tanacetum coccineum]
MATNAKQLMNHLAMTTTNIFEVNHEDAYDSDVDECPNAAAVFMANLSSTSATNSQVNEVHSNDNPNFDNVDYQLSQEMHQDEHLDSDAETEIDDKYDHRIISILLDTKPKMFLTVRNCLVKQAYWHSAMNVLVKTSFPISTWHFHLFIKVDHPWVYEQCVLDNKNLTIEKKNLLIINECLIAECLEKDICSIVLTSDIVVPPSSNCLCEDLRSACDREHTKVLELEAEISKQKQLFIESEKRFAFLEQNYALETDDIQLKDTITSLRIQLDGLKVENVSLKRRTKPATESRKPMPKCHTWNHHILPNKSVNARRAAYHNRKLNVVDHNQFVIRSLKSVNTKTPQAKHSVNHTKHVWKATRNHNVNTTKTAWRPTRKVVGSVKPQWKPTGRHFALYDNCPLTRIMEPIVEPLELTPSVSSSSKVTMISRFTDCKLSDRKAGSKGLSGHLVLGEQASIRKSDLPLSGIESTFKGFELENHVKKVLYDSLITGAYEHVGPKFSEWRIEEKITCNSRKSEIKMKLSNLVIQVSKNEFLLKHKCKTSEEPQRQRANML